MGKWYGKIGYMLTTEGDDPEFPGVWREGIVEKNHFGEITRNIRRYDTVNNQINDNLNINNQFSIVADPFATQNFHAMRYIEYMGTKWKINSVEVQYPRLILQIGGVYNGETEEGTSSDTGGFSWQ